jgi:hypothetical protein
MNKAKAIKLAKKYVKRWRTDRYVVVESGEYAHCSEYDLANWFYGAKVVAYFDQGEKR